MSKGQKDKGKPPAKKMTIAERRRAQLDAAIDGPSKPAKKKPEPKHRKKP